MRLKSLYSTFFAVFVAFCTVSCDDNIDSIGQSLQPDSDGIAFEIDKIQLTAETVSLADHIFVDNEIALLGEINDPVFGNLKADFLSEFYCGGGDDANFKLGYDDEATVDSVRLEIQFATGNFLGDKKKTITLSVYELTKDLETNFNTNIDPSQYCDMSRILGQRFFSVQGLNTYDYTNSSSGITTTYMELFVELDKKYGLDLYKEWKENKKVLSSSQELRKYTKGIYVTTDFSDSGILTLSDINSFATTVVYYSYKLKKVNEPTVDSTAVGYIALPMGYEVNRLNRVVNTSWEELKKIPGNTTSSERTLLKAPAGVITELTIPLAEIKAKGKEKMKHDDFVVSSAVFKLTGLTEEEDKLSISQRPNFLLCINKDSIDNFFSEKKMVDNLTSIVMARNSADNTYSFSNQGYIGENYVTNNLSYTVNHYLKEDPEKKELKFLIIPISTSTNSGQILGVENLFQPAAVIFRTKPQYMSMSLAFSRHNDVE